MSKNGVIDRERETGGPFVFGVWLEYSPSQSLSGEGISRLTSWILEALARREDVRVVLAMAKWSEENVRRLLEEQGVAMERIEIITSRPRLSTFLRLLDAVRTRWRRQPRPRRRRWLRLARRLWRNPLLGGLLRLLLTTDSVLLVCLMAAMMVLLLPVILAGALVSGILWKLLNNRATRRAGGVFRDASVRAQERIRTLRNDRWYPSIVALWKEIEAGEFQRLAKKVSRRRDVRLWFSPNPTATRITDIERPLVVAIPDLVYVDFMGAFRGDWVRRVDQRIRVLAGRADATISYCRDVRERHVLRHLGVAEGRARVIRHGAVDVGPGLRREAGQFAGLSRVAARSIIQRFIQTRCPPPPEDGRIPAAYLRDFPVDEVPYLFVSSQIRPNKNYLQLFRVYERLLRRRYRNLKLLITGDLEHETCGLRAFIDANGLDLDILALPNLPVDVHAAFYHLAALTVVPTLFEGGFPFQFTESLSVGTPVVMSDIAVTREVLPKALQTRTLFDPFDPQAIAGAIDWALDHREGLQELQRPFYQELQRRSWNDVAAEYLDLFKEVAAGSQVR